MSLWPKADEGASLFREARNAADARAARVPVPDTGYQHDPIGWIRDVLGVPEHTIRWSLNTGYEGRAWDQTADPMSAVLDSLVAWENVGVESATTTGKTFLGACLVLWFLACFKDATIVTVAPKKDQLTLHCWKEITRLWSKFQARFPTAELTTLRIRMAPGSDVWAAHGFVAGVSADEAEGSAAKAQGFHAEHMLIVFEETPGIHPAIMTAFKNTCRAPHNLRVAFGNPDHQHDPLHLFCQGPRTRHVIVSALDHPNVVTDNANLIPGAVSRQGIEDALTDAANDGGAESRMYRSRVRGISPAESHDALIHLSWCGVAAEKYGDARYREGLRALGVDVANSENGDKAAIADWQGACLLAVRAFACPNSNQLGRDVAARIRSEGIEPQYIGVDGVGVGAGTVNELVLGGYNVQNLRGNDAPIEYAARAAQGMTDDWELDHTQFANLRSQMYWQLREDLRRGYLALPPDPELHRQLATMSYTTKGGKVAVEPKEQIRKRLGGHSPDKADAVVYGNWVRHRARLVEAPPAWSRDKHPGRHKDGMLKRPYDEGWDERYAADLEFRRAREDAERTGNYAGVPFSTGYRWDGAKGAE